MRIVTWNINSVRLRIELVAKMVKKLKPDVICLQETKCPNDSFPTKSINKMGYEHVAINGIKGYHGVATLSKVPFAKTNIIDYCGQKDGRHIETILDYGGAPLSLHNFYVPAGGDEPDRKINEKFGHKLDFLNEMQSRFAKSKQKTSAQRIIVGDLNIAPYEHDVWSHKQLLKVVSHTPQEVELLEQVRKSHNWIDVARAFVPFEEKLYSWWSYRSKDWDASNRGRRLDHIWVTPALEPQLKSYKIMREARGWERPSDHVPVVIDLA